MKNNKSEQLCECGRKLTNPKHKRCVYCQFIKKLSKRDTSPVIITEA